ncbi:MAG TPA: hypothetical protein V6C97_27875, partial [Oculatellaceae cyanobacterium]
MTNDMPVPIREAFHLRSQLAAQTLQAARRRRSSAQYPDIFARYIFTPMEYHYEPMKETVKVPIIMEEHGHVKFVLMSLAACGAAHIPFVQPRMPVIYGYPSS